MKNCILCSQKNSEYELEHLFCINNDYFLEYTEVYICLSCLIDEWYYNNISKYNNYILIENKTINLMFPGDICLATETGKIENEDYKLVIKKNGICCEIFNIDIEEYHMNTVIDNIKTTTLINPNIKFPNIIKIILLLKSLLPDELVMEIIKFNYGNLHKENLDYLQHELQLSYYPKGYLKCSKCYKHFLNTQVYQICSIFKSRGEHYYQYDKIICNKCIDNKKINIINYTLFYENKEIVSVPL